LDDPGGDLTLRVTAAQHPVLQVTVGAVPSG
jgi:hypothetical protein